PPRPRWRCGSWQPWMTPPSGVFSTGPAPPRSSGSLRNGVFPRCRDATGRKTPRNPHKSRNCKDLRLFDKARTPPYYFPPRAVAGGSEVRLQSGSRTKAGGADGRMANFGETLKRERELRDIPLRDIANATKINLRYLEALEQ